MTGPRNLITDVPGLKVGNASDPDLKSGATVLVPDEPAVASVAIQGGAPGTREIALLEPEQTVEKIDAIVLAGGSAFGLDAGAGVQGRLAELGYGYQVGPVRVPIVPTAILFDLLNGGNKSWGQMAPYRDLGRAALDSIGHDFVLGSNGAGMGATTANLKGGLGSASVVLENGVTIGAIVAVNALGRATMGETPHFWAAPFEVGDEFGGRMAWRHPLPADCAPQCAPSWTHLKAGANTTIAAVATDADDDQRRCQTPWPSWPMTDLHARSGPPTHLSTAISCSHCRPANGSWKTAWKTCSRSERCRRHPAWQASHRARDLSRYTQRLRTITVPTWRDRFGSLE